MPVKRGRKATNPTTTFFCPKCDCERGMFVTDMRASGDSRVRRRRRCAVCAERITTYETTEDERAVARARIAEFNREVAELVRRFTDRFAPSGNEGDQP